MLYKVKIRRVEYYSATLLVEADDPRAAEARVDDAWQDSDALWEKVTDNADDTKTEFTCEGEATQEDVNKFDYVERYL